MERSDEEAMRRLEVNPDANSGVSHAFQEVVRNKEARKQMHGVDCDCCKGVSEHSLKSFFAWLICQLVL